MAMALGVASTAALGAPSAIKEEPIGAFDPTGTTATLRAKVNPEGSFITNCHFVYGTSSPSGHEAPCSPAHPGKNEEQEVNVVADEGQWRLIFESQATGDLPLEASNQEVREALEALSTIGAGNVSVGAGASSGSFTSSYLITFGGKFGGKDVPQLESEDGTEPLSGGSPAVDITTVGLASLSVTIPITGNLSGLAPETEYHYKLVVTNGDGTVEGNARSFRTLSVSQSESCSNTAIRTEQQATTAECRAWEMVSPLDKNGGNVLSEQSHVVAAVDGNGVTYASKAGFADAHGAALIGATDYLARRGSAGWETHAISPTPSPQTFQVIFATHMGVYSEDLGKALMLSYDLPAVSDDGTNELNFYQEDTASGQIRTVSPTTQQVGSNPELFSFLNEREVAASADAEVASFTDPRRLLPEAAGADEEQEVNVKANEGQWRLIFNSEATSDLALGASSQEVQEALEALPAIGVDNVSVGAGASSGSFTSSYLVTFGGKLASKDVPELESQDGTEPLNGGSPEVAIATVGFATNVPNAYEWDHGTLRLAGILPDGTVPSGGSTVPMGGYSSPYRESVSSDGSRITFLTVGENPQLYLRRDHTSTAWVSESEGSTPVAEPAGVSLVWMSPDGRHVAFATTSRLLNSDTNDSRDLYLYTDGPDPESENNLQLISDGIGLTKTTNTSYTPVIGGSADAERLYYLSDDNAGGVAVYYWNHGTNKFLFNLPDSNAFEYGALSYPGAARVSADGLVLAVNEPPPSGIGEGARILVYDAGSDTLTCASCDSSGVSSPVPYWPSETTSIPERENSIREHWLSRDGRKVFFTTASALVPADVNGVRDAYVYDTQTGEKQLISSGRGEANAWFTDASADGDNAFFITRQQLAGSDSDELIDLYDSRVGGGFPEPPPPPTPCSGDGCRGALSTAAGAVSPATSSFSGPGNAHPKVKKPRKRAKHHKRHHKRRHHQEHRAAKGAQGAAR
jgi:hypothetical protein